MGLAAPRDAVYGREETGEAVFEVGHTAFCREGGYLCRECRTYERSRPGLMGIAAMQGESRPAQLVIGTPGARILRTVRKEACTALAGWGSQLKATLRPLFFQRDMTVPGHTQYRGAPRQYAQQQDSREDECNRDLASRTQAMRLTRKRRVLRGRIRLAGSRSGSYTPDASRMAS